MNAITNKTKAAIILCIFCGIGVCLSSLLSLILGAASFPLRESIEAIFLFDETNMNHQIIWDLRIPRTIGDIVCGAAFAVAGAIMQGMTRNPIADSGILGINAGAAFAISVCLALVSSVNYLTITAFSFIGAFVSVSIVYGLTALNHGKQSPARLALVGTLVGAFLSSGGQAISLHFGVGQAVTFWTAGGVAGIRINQILLVAPFIILALICSILISHKVSILSLGDDNAKSLGVNLSVTKSICLVCVLILSGGAVALAGPIGFIGLMIPHIVRSIVGTDYKKIIPCSAIAGSLFMLLADLISRLLNPPHEMPLGLISTALGVPFFLFIIRKRGRDIGV